MIRVVIENILLFLAPVAMYVVYMLLTRRASSAGAVINDAPLIWLFLAGAILVIANPAWARTGASSPVSSSSA
jgi:hypothetical protein